MRDACSVAIDALVRVEGGAFAHVLLPAKLRGSGLDARDRAFVTHLVYGAVRMQRRIDTLVAPRCHQPFDRLEPRVRAALRVGVFQLLEGTAPHAAVGATVEAAPPRARGLVNAVLRSVAALGPTYPEPESMGERYSYPDWVVDELARSLPPAELAAVLETGNQPAALTLRPNPRVTTPDAL
ncbi:MAG: transcription antitermination factor NusB [Actinomycetota bacterium]